MLYDPITYQGIKGGTYFNEQEFYKYCSNKVPKSKSTQSNTKIKHHTTNSNIMYKSQKLFTQNTEKKQNSPKKISTPQKSSPIRIIKQTNSSCSLNCDEYIIKIKEWNQKVMQKLKKTQQISPPKKGILDKCIDSYLKRQQLKNILH